MKARKTYSEPCALRVILCVDPAAVGLHLGPAHVEYLVPAPRVHLWYRRSRVVVVLGLFYEAACALREWYQENYRGCVCCSILRRVVWVE